MRKIFAAVFPALVISLIFLGLSGCGKPYSVIREDPEDADEKEAALIILNEKVPEYYPDADFSTYFFSVWERGTQKTDLISGTEIKASKYTTNSDSVLVNLVSKDIYTNFESQHIIDYAEKKVKELYQLDEDDIETYISFETIVPLFADKVVPSDLTAVQIYELKDFTTASRFLPLGTVVDEAYITEGLESGNLYMQYNIAVDENVDLNDLIEKTDLKTLGINKDIIIEQYSHEDFEGNSWNWLNSFCKPIRTITIKCRLSELLVDMGK